MNEPKITVFYEKFYTDDIGKHIPNLFSKNNYDEISLKSFWGNAIDGFYKYNCLFMITAIEGDFRIVIPYENGNDYKFKQFFISGMDGKIIKIPKNIWFGINNLNSTQGAILISNIGDTETHETLDIDIFDWYKKR